MLPLLLLKGSIIGLSISIPMGPTGVLCLRYSLIRGKTFGLASGLGIALAEAFCGGLTAIGLASITEFIDHNQLWLQLAGSLFLFYFGFTTLKNPEGRNKQVVQKGHSCIFFKMFLVTFTNPLTLLSFVAIFSAMGIETLENDLIAISLLSFGIFVGSTSWWALISSSLDFLSKIRSSAAQSINKITGIAIVAISIFSFFSALKSLII